MCARHPRKGTRPALEEDEQMLSQTLTSLQQAQGCDSFHVVLAMEEREGQEAAERLAFKGLLG